ncbi:MAG: GAF domain-containing protein [Magnetococcus sp. YQC-5]
MPLSDKCILLLDDDEHFRVALLRALKNIGAADVLAPEIRNEAVLEALKKKPTDILLDINLGNDGDALQFLDKLVKQETDLSGARIWLISGRESVDLTHWLTIYPTVQATWLRKPFSATQIKDLLVSVGQESANKFKLPAGLENHPLPLRVLDQSGAVVYASFHWAEVPANMPDPKLFMATFRQGGQPDPVLFTAPKLNYAPASKPTGHHFRLYSYSIDQGKYLVQVAERLARLGYIYRFDELIDQTFEMMRSAGFGRGRYYSIDEIPGCDGVMRLVKLYGSPHATGEHPMYGNMGDRLNHFRTSWCDKKKNELIYRILQRNEEDRQDLGVQYWEERIPKQNLKSWVEIPVLFTRDDGMLQPVALFIFDRLPGSVEEQDVLQDGSPDEVTEQSVQHVAPLLLQVVHDVEDAFRVNLEKSELKTLKQLAQLDEKLLTLSEHNELTQALVQTAVELTKAKSGVLMTKDGGEDLLRVQAFFPTWDMAFLKDIIFSLDQNQFPAVKCWNDGQVRFIPDYQNSDTRKTLIQQYQFTPCENPETLCWWFQHGFASALVLPVGHRTKTVGVLCLHGDKAFQFDAYRVAAVQALLQRIRWFLEAVKEQEQRRLWETIFVHEFRSDLVPAKHLIESVLDNTDTEDLRTALAYMNRVNDLTRNFMSMQTKPDTNVGQTFSSSGALLQDALAQAGRIYPDVMANLRVTVPWKDPVWKTNLHGRQEVFGRVVRCLADNAYKYSEGETPNITVTVKVDDGIWILTLSNPGHMSAEEDRLKFTPYQQLQRSGAHVALAFNQAWTKVYGGNIELENVTENGYDLVQATLRWPLATNKNGAIK